MTVSPGPSAVVQTPKSCGASPGCTLLLLLPSRSLPPAWGLSPTPPKVARVGPAHLGEEGLSAICKWGRIREEGAGPTESRALRR